MRKLLLLWCFVAMATAQIFAQGRPITGKVLDETGAPIVGASVVIRGTRTGTTTNADGSFIITVPSNNAVLVISSVNYETQNITVGSLTIVEARLKAAASNPMEEVVVIGYTTARKKRDEAGAISSVRAKQIENLPNISVDKALQGKAAGVLVQANNGIPGGNINVRIRGAGSINAGNDPLYIVDGIQLNQRNDAAFTQSNPLSFLNPDDIESIDIIKDAASAAVYGSNAANGVVIITTKKGRAGKTRFTFNTYFGVVSPLKYMETVNSQQYFQLRAEAIGNTNNLPATDLAIKRAVLTEMRVVGASTMTSAQADSAVASLKTYDWEGEVFNNSSIKNYELAASGGNERTTFRISGNITDQGTIVTKANFKRYGLKADVTNKANDRLTFGTTLNLSTFNQNLPFSTDGSFLGSPAFSGSAILPFNPIYNQDGSYYGVPGGNPGNIAGTLNQNIVAVNAYNTGFQRTNQIVGSLNTDYKIFEWLSFRLFGGIDWRLVQGKQVRDARTPDAFARKGLVQTQSNWNTNIHTYGTLNWNHLFGQKHRVDGFVGYEYRKENNESISASGDGFPTYQFTSLNNAANPLSVGEFFTGFRRNAVFGNANYSFDGKYIIGLTGRYDGSSRFGAGQRYGVFAGIKTAWNIDRESFLQDSRVVSALRLRLSYGSVGNDQIGNFDALGLFGGGGVYNGGAGIAFTQLENPDLKWETTTIANVGLDFGFWNNRLNGIVEVYDKKTSDLLLTLPVQSSTGFTGITSNIGKMRNRGIELTLGGDPIKAKRAGDFNWNVNFVYAFNDQEVTELYGGFNVLPANASIRVGEPVGVLFTQEYAGVNPATGRPMWYDTLGNLTYQVQARDRKVLGPTVLSPHQGGLRNTFTFKGFTLDAFFSYEYGRYATDGQINFLFENIGRINELTYIYENRWTTPGQITDLPRMLSGGTEVKGSGQFSGDRMWFKADYIRLRNITVSYDVPANVLSRFKVNNARFYVQGTNLVTWSDWFSYDIEFVNTATGIIPQTKNVTVGLQLGF